MNKQVYKEDASSLSSAVQTGIIQQICTKKIRIRIPDEFYYEMFLIINNCITEDKNADFYELAILFVDKAIKENFIVDDFEQIILQFLIVLFVCSYCKMFNVF